MKFLPLLLVAAFPVASLAEEAAEFANHAREKLREITQGDTTGIAVLVSRDGKVILEGGFGFANLDAKIPIETDTKFRIGSVTKQFTAAAILRLAEEGKLSLDDSVAKYFPDFPRAKEITIRRLLTHTSGLHSYTDKPEFMGRVTQPIAPADLIAWFRDDPPDFEPGAGFHYCNSGYFLAGEIVAKICGKPFDPCLREILFEPLGMHDTGVFDNANPPAKMATGYSFADGKPGPAIDWDMSWAGGAGALYSTVGDLFRWNEAFFGGRVLEPESLKTATTPISLPDGPEAMNYGLGLVMTTVGRLPAIVHGGGLNGWSSQLIRFPEQKCTIVVLANSMPAPPNHAPGPLAELIATKALADEMAKVPPRAEDKSVDPKTFAAFVGRYDYKNAVMTITMEGDALFAQLSGQPKFRIFPSSPTKFFWKVTDAQVAFVRDEKGEVTGARHTQGGVSFLAAKLKDEGPALTREQLEAYVGKYQYGPGSVMTISLEGNQLQAQLTGQQKYPIFPKSETEFGWRVVEASVRFVKDDAGKATKAVHSQGGQTFEAPKIE